MLNKLVLKCKECKNIFYKWPSQKHGSGFCSRSCFSKSRYSILNCLTCNRDFKRYNCNIKNNDNSFCSLFCTYVYPHILARNKIKRLFCNSRISADKSFRNFWHYHDPQYVRTFLTQYRNVINPPKTIKNCVVCSKQYTKVKSASIDAKYCSKKCMNFHHIEKVSMTKCSMCCMYFIRSNSDIRDNKKRYGDTPIFCGRKCFNSFTQPISRHYKYCGWCDMRFTKHTNGKSSPENIGVTCSQKCRRFYEKYVDLGRTAWNKGIPILPHVEKALRYGFKQNFEQNGPWNKGIPHTEKHKMKLRIARKDRIYPYYDTKPEIIMQKALRLNNIEFEKHKSFTLSKRFHRVDIFIEPNICIEVDGNYWHKLPERIERDIFVNDELRSQGMKVYRFWESDIIKDVQLCVETVQP